MKVLVTHTFKRTLEVEVQTDSEEFAKVAALQLARDIQTADWTEELEPVTALAEVTSKLKRFEVLLAGYAEDDSLFVRVAAETERQVQDAVTAMGADYKAMESGPSWFGPDFTLPQDTAALRERLLIDQLDGLL